eukprot:CAMPEP_0182884958 /NCGR_PEP_ID=MMETSP0034_2-20130328/19317_1 /TAXON_ID=156128 /ORGANISM="Nephroselmis pyriformis, Strain CCMP717" /LENGTH=237 /DNA_ID=CAMNT_0025018199 /DNA_START=8 /DNA_END=717 /DNA_ORIENTATION=-
MSWQRGLAKRSGTLTKLRAAHSILAAFENRYEELGEGEMDRTLKEDMVKAIAAAAVVGALVLVGTASPFLTCCGMLHIMLSFPSAFFVYKLVLGFKYFPFLNFLGMFVILGIGADDIFVFYDGWRHSEDSLARAGNPRPSAEEIMADCYGPAAGAMAVTSFTTAVAFFATAVVPVAPLRLFAVFMGFLTLFDYLYVVTFFPAIVTVQHNLVQKSGFGAGGEARRAAWWVGFFDFRAV